MHQVILNVNSDVRAALLDSKIDVVYVQHMISLVLNTIKTTKYKQVHRIKIELVDVDYSYYAFNNTLSLTKHCFLESTRNKQVYSFYNDLMHELGHYIQFKIDKINITEFIVDVDNVSRTKYLNNSTERQARRYGNTAMSIITLYNKLNKLRS